MRPRWASGEECSMHSRPGMVSAKHAKRRAPMPAQSPRRRERSFCVAFFSACRCLRSAAAASAAAASSAAFRAASAAAARSSASSFARRSASFSRFRRSLLGPKSQGQLCGLLLLRPPVPASIKITFCDLLHGFFWSGKAHIFPRPEHAMSCGACKAAGRNERSPSQRGVPSSVHDRQSAQSA